MIIKNAGKHWVFCLFTACLTLWSSAAFAEDSSCKEGKQMCMENTRYECSNHRWKLVEECHKPASCVARYNEGKIIAKCENAEPCEDGEYTCFGASICHNRGELHCNDQNKEMYKCKNGHWEFVKTCPNANVCEIGKGGKAKCEPLREEGKEHGKIKINTNRDCSHGSYKCDGNAVMFCNHGIWVSKIVCNEGMVCKSISDRNAKCLKADNANDNRTPVNKNAKHCKDGAYLCFGAEELYHCNDGRWQLITKCPGACELQDDGTANCSVQ